MKAVDTQQGDEAPDALHQAREGQWLPHPAVLILLWVILAVTIQLLHAKPLLLAGIPLMLLVLKLSAARLRTLLRRTRWIMLSLLLIYGYATPGTALWEPLGMLSPTLEGLLDGLLQLCRLILALAGLAVVLGLLSRQQLIGGLYALAYPLHYIGLPRERLAVRLALTLHYAESAMRDTAADWRGSLERMLSPVEIEPHSIELHVARMTWRDGLLLGGAALALGLALL